MSNEEIVKKIKDGIYPSDNLAELYQKNYRLIYQLAFRYGGNNPNDIEDLLQEAYFGLVKAVEKYECDKEVKFVTFATYWIRQAIVRYTEDYSNLVRLPNAFFQNFLKYYDFTQSFYYENGRQPTDAEVMKSLGVCRRALKELKQTLYRNQNTASFDSEIKIDEDTRTLSEVIADPSVDIENQVCNGIMSKQYKEVWNDVKPVLNESELSVVKQTYIDNKSLADIGRETGRSRERIRQIHNNALQKLSKREKFFREKYDIVMPMAYHGSVGDFKRTFTSSTEKIILKLEKMEKGVKV